MAGGGTTVRATWRGITALAADLDAIEVGMQHELSAAITAAAEPIVARARTLTPVGPGPRGPGDSLPHINTTLFAQQRGPEAAVVTSHPGGSVIEFGGVIAPRGTAIVIKPHRMVGRAAEQVLPQVQQDLERRLNALVREHGL